MKYNKSSDAKKPVWNRAKVVIGAAGPLLGVELYDTRSMKNQKDLLKTMKIHGNPSKSTMKIFGCQEAWNRAKVAIEAAGPL